jgi:hypothetical protein
MTHQRHAVLTVDVTVERGRVQLERRYCQFGTLFAFRAACKCAHAFTNGVPCDVFLKAAVWCRMPTFSPFPSGSLRLSSRYWRT